MDQTGRNPLNISGKRIILASGSPRRRELLAGLDVDFEVDTRNNFTESVAPGTDPREVPMLMARGKSDGFHRPLSDSEILITADTVVLCGQNGHAPEVLGKPHSREDAVRMLRELSGNTHEVVTAVVIRDSAGRREEFADSTLVTFSTLSNSQIDYYIDRYKPFDKAGAYGIQEWIGYVGIEKIQGSFYNVMGFPVHRVYEALNKFL